LLKDIWQTFYAEILIKAHEEVTLRIIVVPFILRKLLQKLLKLLQNTKIVKQIMIIFGF